MKKLIGVIAVAALTAAPAFAAAKTKPHPSVKQEDLKWAQPLGPEGPSFGFVEGKFGDNKPASFFVKFTAGKNAPWHFHHHDYQGVVLKGTFTETQKGEALVELPPGTWFSQPAIQVHQNGCKAGGDDCVVFIHFDKGADSVMTDENGKPLPPPKKEAAKPAAEKKE